MPEQAEIVKEIFASCLAGNGTYTIAKSLNDRGIPTKKGGKWHGSTINGILTNEKYTGNVIFQKTYTDSSFRRHTNYGEQDMFLCADHHEAIVSHEDFDKVREILDRRAMEKGNGSNTSRYQRRYAFSGKIKCGNCGSSFKRRQHYKPSGDYVAWTCDTHLRDKDACSMLYIKDEAIKAAFATMMNKLIFGNQEILKPLMRSLRGMDDKDRLIQINVMGRKIEENADKKQTLATLMAQGLLDAAVYNSASHNLMVEEQELKDRKEELMNNIGGDKTKVRELQALMDFTSKGEMLTEFDEELFTAFVENIIVQSREEITFRLKCGLKLEERLVRADAT